MTPTAKALNDMMLIADQYEELEAQVEHANRMSGDPAVVAKLQQQMRKTFEELNCAWDTWNDAILAERFART
jgi:hypothetical protein